MNVRLTDIPPPTTERILSRFQMEFLSREIRFRSGDFRNFPIPVSSK